MRDITDIRKTQGKRKADWLGSNLESTFAVVFYEPKMQDMVERALTRMGM